MIIKEFAEYCFVSILDVYYNDEFDERDKFLRSFAVLKEFLLKIDEDNEQIFSGFYQRLHFIVKNYDIKHPIAKKLHSLRFFAGKLSKDKSITLTTYELSLRLCDIFVAIGSISGAGYPHNVEFMSEDILNENRNIFYEKKKKQKGEKVDHLRAIVENVESWDDEEKKIVISAKNEHYDNIKVCLSGFWFGHKNMYSEGTVLSLVNIGFDGAVYYTHQYSLLSVEPDYLIDVTEIADCFGLSAANPHMFFLSRLDKSTVGEAAIVGNLVNHIFDELIYNPEVDFDSAFERGLNVKPIQIISLMSSGANLQSIRERVIKQYHKLKLILAKQKSDKKTVEPSFISPVFGLQGRLDLLLDSGKVKSVVELKSGKAPNSPLMYSDIDNKRYSLSIWKNHVVQAVCYIMLLESKGEDHPAVTSSILYSGAEESPLRNVPNILNIKKEILKCRNYIIAVERAITKNNFSIFKKFNYSDFGYLPSYKQNMLNSFALNYKGSSQQELDYFHNFTGFISREAYFRKTGSNVAGNGFSGLWLDTIEEKENNYTILRYLQLDKENSNFDKMHLSFKITKNKGVSTFRKGDICILYRIPENGKISVTSEQILKASIRSMTTESILLSFRNKMYSDEFAHDYEWAIEPDNIDAISKLLHSSLYSLISSPKTKRDVLLGNSPPANSDVFKVYYPELNETQLDLLYKALSAKDYFLLQGPPGTGKTSYMLRFLVKYLFDNTDENILLLAYTNRAADEICSAIKRIEQNFPFLRIGGKESTEHPENLLALIAEQDNISSLFHRINETRVFVSTATSILTTADLLKIKKFSTVIIDEAGQISEPYILSILTTIDKAILIGDEKQLPAVVVQPQRFLSVAEERLKQVNLNNLGVSFFERMLENAKRNNWTECYGMLTHQGRMNKSIMDLANFLFYGGKLQLADVEFDDLPIMGSRQLTKALAAYDIIFIDTPCGKQSKRNIFEAEIAVDLATDIASKMKEYFDNSSLGIIAPFRAQVSEIFNRMPEHLQDKITIDTVERFQGSEREIIIISFAVNNIYEAERAMNCVEIDGIIVDRKLNVAITRAKKKLVLLGNRELLSKSNLYKQMFDFIESNHLIIQYDKIV